MAGGALPVNEGSFAFPQVGEGGPAGPDEG